MASANDTYSLCMLLCHHFPAAKGITAMLNNIRTKGIIAHGSNWCIEFMK